MLKAAMSAGHYMWLVIFAVLMAAVSVYYYFRIIQAMYFKEGDAQPLEITPAFKWTLVILAGLVILLGIFPNFLLGWYYF
jgi:NADH-quinone oxidoreductase subunit N